MAVVANMPPPPNNRLPIHLERSLAVVQFHISHRMSHMMHDLQYQLLEIANADNHDYKDRLSASISSLRKMDRYRRDLLKPIELIRYLSQHHEPVAAQPFMLIRDWVESDSEISCYVGDSAVSHEHDKLTGVLDTFLLEQCFDGLIRWMLNLSTSRDALDFSVHHYQSALIMSFKGMQPGTFHDMNHIEKAADNNCYLLKSIIILNEINGLIEKCGTSDSLSEDISIKYPVLWRKK